MLDRLEKTYELYHSDGEDAYGQASEHMLIGIVEVKISHLDYSTDRHIPKFVNSTHLGLTKDNSINVGDILKANGDEFQVEYIILETRLIQLFLKKV